MLLHAAYPLVIQSTRPGIYGQCCMLCRLWLMMIMLDWMDGWYSLLQPCPGWCDGFMEGDGMQVISSSCAYLNSFVVLINDFRLIWNQFRFSLSALQHCMMMMVSCIRNCLPRGLADQLKITSCWKKLTQKPTQWLEWLTSAAPPCGESWGCDLRLATL